MSLLTILTLWMSVAVLVDMIPAGIIATKTACDIQTVKRTPWIVIAPYNQCGVVYVSGMVQFLPTKYQRCITLIGCRG